MIKSLELSLFCLCI